MSHKRCSKCGIIKTISDFSPHPKTRDKRQSNCKECRRLMSERLKRSKGIINREEWLNRVRKPREVRRTEYNERKSLGARKRKILFINILGGKCIRCEIKLSAKWPSSCFEFHHPNGRKDKNDTIAALLRYTDERALIELKKCQLVCANCHRAIHSPALEADGLSG